MSATGDLTNRPGHGSTLGKSTNAPGSHSVSPASGSVSGLSRIVSLATAKGSLIDSH